MMRLRHPRKRRENQVGRLRMWCPTPKPKVIPRPKPTFGRHHRQLMKADAASGAEPTQCNDFEEEAKQKEQPDPHRDARHYGMRHTDITRRFSVEDRACHVPDQPYGLKKTDITRYLERVVPSHAFQPSSAMGQSPNTPRNAHAHPYKKQMGALGGARPARPPSRCETRERRSRLGQAPIDTLRPDTAPTGEMKRLSASNASTVNFGSKPATAGSRRAMTSSPLNPLEGPTMAPPPHGSLRHGSRPGSTQASEPGGGRGGLPDSESGFKDSRVDSTGCTLMTASSHTSGGRLQSVPE